MYNQVQSGIDSFVNQLFESVGLPLLRYPSKNRYTPNDVGGKLNSILMKTNE